MYFTVFSDFIQNIATLGLTWNIAHHFRVSFEHEVKVLHMCMLCMYVHNNVCMHVYNFHKKEGII